MEKLISFALTIALTIATSAITTKVLMKEPVVEPVHNLYSVPNALYLDGEVITPEDQFIWAYEDDNLPTDTVVTVIFDDNGTPDCIEDDPIVTCIVQLVH